MLSQCTVCKDGYYLANSKCEKCQIGVSTCTSFNFALSCSTGYTADSELINTGTVLCVNCVFPCKTCNSDPAQCDSCVDGYYLEGWKCVTTFNFEFSITLQINIAIFYQNYLLFLQILVTFIFGPNINAITIQAIGTKAAVSSSSFNLLTSADA